MRTLFSAAIVVLAAAVTLPARVPATGAQDKPADVAGTWAITVEIGGNTGTPTLTLKQDGEKLTGTYASQVFGEQKVTGSIKGNDITFGFTASLEGNNVTVTYTGTVDKATMKGKVALGELGEGTFTAKKQ
jgi:hypothetical protein